MTKKSPLEFYDEELSRTIRQVQQGLLELEWPSFSTDGNETNHGTNATTTKTSPEDVLATVDKLLTCSGVFMQQMESVVQGLPKRSDDKKQWTEILKFRTNTLAVLAKERANVKVFSFPTMEDNNNSGSGGSGSKITS